MDLPIELVNANVVTKDALVQAFVMIVVSEIGESLEQTTEIKADGGVSTL
jgi:hypothetical protein